MNGILVWITDHLLWLLGGAWLLSLAGVALAGRATWRWVRRRRASGDARWRSLAGSALAAVAALGGLLFTTSGLLAVGPGLVLQQRMVGSAAPEVAYSVVGSGAPATLAGHRGSVVLVNVWATWCGPCRVEMPELDRLQRDLAARGLVVLHLSDEDPAVLAAFLEEHPTSAEHGQIDPLPWPETGRPTSYVVDRNGVVRRVVLGSRDSDQFRSLVQPYF